MPKLSIIIPVYNVENYLRRCIDSVIYPQLSDYEIILVNDGSTDSSPAICREYADKYPGLIRLINTPNGGLGHARNTGTDASESEYILYLDSDDRLVDGALEKLLSATEQDFDVCFFDFVAVDERDKELFREKGCARQEPFTLEEYPEILFFPPNAWNKVWRRSLFTENNIRYPDRIWFEDLHTSPKLYLKAQKMIYLPYTLHEYLQRDGSIMRNKNPQRNLEMLQVTDSVIGFFKENGAYDKFSSQLCYLAMFHQVITSTTRVNRSDRKSDVQHKLFEDFVSKFPDYRKNPYVKAMPAKIRLLLFFIEHKMYLCFSLVMGINDLIKYR